MTSGRRTVAAQPATGQMSVDASLYDEQYYTVCEGYQAYAAGPVPGLSTRLRTALDLASVGPGMRILDVGCGRGEVVYHSALQGAQAWGVDYSRVGTQTAARSLCSLPEVTGQRAWIGLANALAVPFASGTFDVVFMLDLVEHLYPWQLDLALAQARRVLREGGRLVVHTMPNRWCHQFGYPISRLLNRFRGRILPRVPRGCSEYHRCYHVNEMDILKLRAVLKRAGLVARVWTSNQCVAQDGVERNAILPTAIARLPGLRLVTHNEILAIATKRLK